MQSTVVGRVLSKTLSRQDDVMKGLHIGPTNLSSRHWSLILSGICESLPCYKCQVYDVVNHSVALILTAPTCSNELNH